MHQSNDVDDAFNNVVVIVKGQNISDILYAIFLSTLSAMGYGYVGLRHAVLSCSTWYLVPGTWYLVPGTRYLE